MQTRGGESNPPSVRGSRNTEETEGRLAPETIPKARSARTGESVDYVPDPEKRWYVFRASYGRCDKASDYLIEDGTYVYIAKRYTLKSVNGKKKKVLEPLVPNLLFVYTTQAKAEEYIKDAPPACPVYLITTIILS